MMENKIYSPIDALNASKTYGIAEAISSNFRKHFSKIIFAISIVAIAYVIKMAGFFTENKKSDPVKAINNKNEPEELFFDSLEEQEGFSKPYIKPIPTKEIEKSDVEEDSEEEFFPCSQSLSENEEEYKSNNLNTVKLSKKKYSSLINFISNNVDGKRKNILLGDLAIHVDMSSDGYACFTNEEAIGVYSKTLISSGYIKHPLSGVNIDSIIYVGASNPLFKSLEKIKKEAPGVKEGCIIEKGDFVDFANKEAKSIYGPNAIADCFIKGSLDVFNKILDEERQEFIKKSEQLTEEEKEKGLSKFDYTIIGTIESTTWIAYADDALTQFSYLKRNIQK